MNKYKGFLFYNIKYMIYNSTEKNKSLNAKTNIVIICLYKWTIVERVCGMLYVNNLDFPANKHDTAWITLITRMTKF